MTLRIRTCVLASLIFSGIGCSLFVPSYRAEMAAERNRLATTTDTVYRRRLQDLIRRSQLVRTDSLVRWNTSIPSTPDSALHRVRREIACEELRLLVAHGQAATLRAITRMADSLDRNGFDYVRYSEKSLAASGPPLEFRKGDCGVDSHRLLPDSLEYEVYPTRRTPSSG